MDRRGISKTVRLNSARKLKKKERNGEQGKKVSKLRCFIFFSFSWENYIPGRNLFRIREKEKDEIRRRPESEVISKFYQNLF